MKNVVGEPEQDLSNQFKHMTLHAMSSVWISDYRNNIWTELTGWSRHVHTHTTVIQHNMYSGGEVAVCTGSWKHS